MSVTLESFLSEIGLEKYLPALSSAVSSVEQLQTYDDAKLNEVVNTAQMLKGHAMKFKRRVEESKSGPMAPVVKPSGSTPAAIQIVTIGNESTLLASKLHEIEMMKSDLDNFKKFIAGIDLEKYKTILGEIEEMQKIFVGDLPICMEVEKESTNEEAESS
jgi:hypothetical protein